MEEQNTFDGGWDTDDESEATWASEEEADETRFDFLADAELGDSQVPGPTREERDAGRGFVFVWEHTDDSLMHAFRQIDRMAGDLVEHLNRVDVLEQVGGMDLSTRDIPWNLTLRNGPLVMAGLQILAFFAVACRDDIAKALESIPNNDLTPEQEAEEAAARDKVAEKIQGQADAAAEAQIKNAKLN